MKAQKPAKNLVCIDSTHCTTAYDFKLITIMIIDSYGEGIPVAWLISNKDDYLVLLSFLMRLKKELGILQLPFSCPMMLSNLSTRGRLYFHSPKSV